MTDSTATAAFIPTKAHARFVEFAQACADSGYIGVCHGRPGVGKTFSARQFEAVQDYTYPQLYSRIGFIHEFPPLSKDEMHFIFGKHWQELGFKFDKDIFLDVETMNAAIRITQGNFRLIERLFSQIRRVLEINNVDRITAEVVEAARNLLVIGKP